MEDIDFQKAIKASEHLITQMEEKLSKAIEKEDWRIVSLLDSYIDGMKQILCIFKSDGRQY